MRNKNSLTGKYLTGEYILKEVSDVAGYVTDSREIKFKAEKQTSGMVITILEGEEALKNKETDIDNITFVFESKEVFK